MIRIDLSRDELQKPQGQAQKLLSRFNIPVPSSGKGGAQLDPVTIVVVVVSFAAAALPTLFVNQYKTYMAAENQAQIAALKKTIEEVGAEIVRLTPYQKELESYEAQKKQVRERLDVIRQLQIARGTPVNVLDAVGQSLPAGTWLRQMDFKSEPSGAVISLDGVSLSNEEISDFIDKLSESVYFQDVTLKDVLNVQLDGIDARSFRAVAHPKARSLAAETSPAVPGAPAPK